jgi:hypothetical protein
MTDFYPFLLLLFMFALLGGVWWIFSPYYKRRVTRIITDVPAGTEGNGTTAPPATPGTRRPKPIKLVSCVPNGFTPAQAENLAARAASIHRRMVLCFAAALGVLALLRTLVFVWSSGAATADTAVIDLFDAASLMLAPLTIFVMAVLPSGRIRLLPGVLLFGLCAGGALDYVDFGGFVVSQVFLAASTVVLVSRTVRPLAVILLAVVLAGGLFIYPAGLAIRPLFHALGSEYALDREFSTWLAGFWPAAAEAPWILVYLVLSMLVAAPIASRFVGSGGRRGRDEILVAIIFVCGVGLVLLGPADSWVPIFVAMLGTGLGLLLVVAAAGYFLRMNRAGYLPGLLAQVHLAVGAVGVVDSFILPVLARGGGSMFVTNSVVLGMIGVYVLGYVLTLYVGLLRARAMMSDPGRQLLLLRTFGNPGNARGLLAGLEDAWRRIGRVDLVAAGDVADVVVRPESFHFHTEEHMSARLIRCPADLRDRLQSIDTKADLDLRYPVNEFLCAPDTWRDAVFKLLPEADIVLIDLRGFAAANRGCIYELNLLVEHFPLDRAVLVIDASTDRQALEETLADAEAAASARVKRATDGPRQVTTVNLGQPHCGDAEILHTALFRSAASSP